MPDYWLDSDILIAAKRTHYSFRRVPTFWTMLETKAAEGILSCPFMVFVELIQYEDELAEWAKKRKDTPLFTDPSSSVQLKFNEIADWIDAQFQPRRVAEVLKGADAWLVAYASALGGSVVTAETEVGIGAKKVKIPNLCKEFVTVQPHPIEGAAASLPGRPPHATTAA